MTKQIGIPVGVRAHPAVTVGLSALFVACWSSGFIGAKLGAGDAEVTTVLMWRFLPLALVLLPVAWFSARRRATMPTSRTLARQAVIGVLSQSGYLLTVYWAIGIGVNTGTTALVDGIQPLVAAALLGPLLGVAVSGRQWIGLVLGLGGVAIVTAADAGSDSAAPWWSYAIPFVGMLSLVAATFVEQRSPAAVSPLRGLAIHCSTSAIVFTMLALAGGHATPPGDIAFWRAMVWLVVLSTFGGYGLYWILLRRVGVTRVNTLMFLIAPVTAVWGAVMFGESFTVVTALGLAVGIAAVTVVTAAPGVGRSRPSGAQRGVRGPRAAAGVAGSSRSTAPHRNTPRTASC
ncbi:DMT family transporter [Williamsia maris]|uniref:Permease of the drug/metabolite transporter (DMT) superfamily n=1 Tax=Williamsia maris TaxID=72806 RepID=A0ABT1HC15_9NOCA|nr:DMT family transporter [Williamsia maris]MCP2175812.1 Permease of the drug/metabolite transporter (DMT) superfamily [Williamsia maris]